jgi:serine phosphatase RsbU (regulator of sigma subunit)/anti-sigma regulatory factor (Ser/Thr protein kinase)
VTAVEITAAYQWGIVMKNKEQGSQPVGTNNKGNTLRIWSRLQVRMAISYISVTLIIVLLLEFLLILIIYFIVVISPATDDIAGSMVRNTAQTYGLEATVQAKRTAIDPASTFQPGQVSSIAPTGAGEPIWFPYLNNQVPYINTPPASYKLLSFALLIGPDGNVLASSYPRLYPVSTLAADDLPGQSVAIRNALTGRASSNVQDTVRQRVAFAVQPVLGKDNRPIGAVYVQMTLPFSRNQGILNLSGSWFIVGSALIWLLPIVPLGGIFGIVTTGGVVRRIHRLVKATAHFAGGDYTQRVPTKKRDEVGQLERQFNSMAEQLIASIARQQELAEQQVRLEERARIEQEMLTARHIQQSLLPKEVPALPDWQFTPYYKPAKEVGGDFYDFLVFGSSQLGMVIGDVSGKGVPAALVMAMTCTMLRTIVQEITSPGEVLARINELLVAHVPPGTFVTCFYGVLDLESGHMRFANAGHDFPYHQQGTNVSELQATGMPLGLMPGMHYEELEVTLAADESVLFYSDGLVEAHNKQREMFGFPRLMKMLGKYPGDTTLIDSLLRELTTFTGNTWEQEDDVTMVRLQRVPVNTIPDKESQMLHLLKERTFASVPGNEREAMEWVAEEVQSLHLSPDQLANLKTAVAEVVMNAMEHGNHYQPESLVALQILSSATSVVVRVRDQREGELHPVTIPGLPNLEAKLAGLETPRGWGLFLIKNLVDEMREINEEHSHTVEIAIHFKT